MKSASFTFPWLKEVYVPKEYYPIIEPSTPSVVAPTSLPSIHEVRLAPSHRPAMFEVHVALTGGIELVAFQAEGLFTPVVSHRR
jgi:hypothetical protein